MKRSFCLRRDPEFVYSFWSSFWLPTNLWPSSLLWNEWSGMTFQSECVALLRLLDNSTLRNVPLKTVLFFEVPSKRRQFLGLNKPFYTPRWDAWLFLWRTDWQFNLVEPQSQLVFSFVNKSPTSLFSKLEIYKYHAKTCRTTWCKYQKRNVPKHTQLKKHLH